MTDGGVGITFNPDDGSVEIRLAGPRLTVEGLEGEVTFERMTEDGESAYALWVEPAEAVVLGKMIRYILENVRITETSRTTLEALLPRVDAIGSPPAAPPGESSATS